MLNVNRIKMMTALALYEQNGGNHEIRISNYKRRDYVSLHMFTTAIITSAAYFLLVIIVCLALFSSLLSSLSNATIIIYGIFAVVGYVVCLIASLIYANKHYKEKHKLAKKHAKSYYMGLQQIAKAYKIEKRHASKDLEMDDLKEIIEGAR